MSDITVKVKKNQSCKMLYGVVYKGLKKGGEEN